jgi:hypothetical protein
VLVLAGSAQARIGWTWGYNNLSATNPPAHTCSDPDSIAGIACSGWSNWDYSQVDWNSGSARFVIGFICSSNRLLVGRVHGASEPKTTYTEVYYDWCPGHYNKVAVAHFDGTYNYLQSRALIFP